ncbi:MAG: hypothetical protein FWF66_03275 [Candidatus Bathyarchaeota archaeon]|nr:hypothetical protein [Candidatus Termiticorpusculum sp.]
MFKKTFLMTFSVFLIVAMAFMPVFATVNFASGDDMFGKIEIDSSLKEANRHVYYSFLSGRIINSFPTALVQDEFGEEQSASRELIRHYQQSSSLSQLQTS